MEILTNLKSPTTLWDWFIRVVICGFIYTAIDLVLQFLFMFLQPTTPVSDPILGIILRTAAGMIIAFTLGYVSTKYSFSFVTRYVLLFILFLGVFYLLNAVEYIFFSTVPLSQIFIGSLYQILDILLITAVITMLFPPEEITDSFVETMKNFFSGQTKTWWTFRVFVAGIAWLVIYFSFGLIVSPIVVPYYLDPSNGLNLIIAPFEVLIPLQIIRGIIYCLLLIPVMVMTKSEKWRLVLYLAGVFIGLGTLAPMVTNQTWPLVLTITHTLELIADGLVFSFVLVILFRKFNRVGVNE